MNTAVIYCYPQVEARTYFPLAKRFADSWKAHDPGHSCELIVGANGSQPRPVDLVPFDGLKYELRTHSNYGWDIGLYQWLAHVLPDYLLVALGASTWITRPGWLSRLWSAFVEHGPGLYGAFGARYPHPHLRTTALMFPAALLREYPRVISSDRRSRYGFEHGPDNFTRFVLRLGLTAAVVSWRGVFPWPDWNDRTLPGPRETLVKDRQHG